MDTFVQVNLNKQIDGDTIEYTLFRFFDAADSALDLSMVTPKLMIRKGGYRGKLVRTCVIGDGLTWDSQSSGRLALSNISIDWGGHGTYYYDLQFTYDDLTIRTFVRGEIPIEKQVTT